LWYLRPQSPLIPVNFFLHNTIEGGFNYISADELVRHAINNPYSRRFDQLALFAMHLGRMGRRVGVAGSQVGAAFIGDYVRNNLWQNGGWSSYRLNEGNVEKAWGIRYRQIEANRRNALKSTGPQTEAGKQLSRSNAVRHGLTAETVIGALEDAEDYKAFEAAVIADYDAQSAVERELVLRLASTLWRLRRATTMETGLFEIQAHHLQNYRESSQLLTDSRDVIHTLFRRAEPDSNMKTDETVEFARCFLLLANLPNFALDRLSRYEATLWRQAARILFALDALDRRKPQERMSRRRLGNDIFHTSPVHIL
jgi:hypothetical protein